MTDTSTPADRLLFCTLVETLGGCNREVWAAVADCLRPMPASTVAALGLRRRATFAEGATHVALTASLTRITSLELET